MLVEVSSAFSWRPGPREKFACWELLFHAESSSWAIKQRFRGCFGLQKGAERGTIATEYGASSGNVDDGLNWLAVTTLNVMKRPWTVYCNWTIVMTCRLHLDKLHKSGSNPLTSLAKVSEVTRFLWGLRIRAWVWMVGGAALLLNLSCSLGLSPPTSTVLCLIHKSVSPGTVLAPRLARGRRPISTGTSADSASEPDIWPQSSVAPSMTVPAFLACSPLPSLSLMSACASDSSGSLPERFSAHCLPPSLLRCVLSQKSWKEGWGTFPLCSLSRCGQGSVIRVLNGPLGSWPPGQTVVVSCGTKQEACKWTDWDRLEEVFSPSGTTWAETLPEVGRNPGSPGRGQRMQGESLTAGRAPAEPSRRCALHPPAQEHLLVWGEDGLALLSASVSFLPALLDPSAVNQKQGRTSRDQSLAAHFLTRNRSC